MRQQSPSLSGPGIPELLEEERLETPLRASELKPHILRAGKYDEIKAKLKGTPANASVSTRKQDLDFLKQYQRKSQIRSNHAYSRDVPIHDIIDFKRAKIKLINRKKELMKGMNMEMVIKHFHRLAYDNKSSENKRTVADHQSMTTP